MASGLDDEAAQATATATASPTTPSTSAADDAKARREARKARILGKGSDRLAKLTKQARGDEAEMLYPSSSSPSSSSPAASPATPRRAAPPQVASASPAAAAGDDVHEDPEEIDISNQGRMDAELQQAMTAFQQQQQRSQQQSVPQDPFAQMMAAMSGQGGGGGPGGAGGGGGGGPAGMPDLGQLLAALQGQQQQPGGGGMPGMDGSDPSSNMFPPGMAQFLQQQGQQQPAPASGSRFADRIFSLIHIVLFSLLGFLALSSTLSYSSSGGSPGYDQQVAAKEYREGSSAGVDGSLESQAVILKWASLAYYRPSLADAAYFELDGRWLGFQSAVPIFWLFITLEVLLQSTRILIFSSRPPPSGLLFSLASQLPFPTLQWALKTGARYASIAGSFLDDVAVLVFTLGVGVLWCASRASAAGAVP